jgi:hypothetical protein
MKKIPIKDLIEVWSIIVMKGPRKFFAKLYIKEKSVIGDMGKRASYITFFIAVLGVYEAILIVSYNLKKNFISDDIANAFDLSILNLDAGDVAGYLAFLAFLFLILQSLLLYYSVKVVSYFSKEQVKVKFESILEAKSYLYAYAIFPYVLSVIIIVLISKLQSPSEQTVQTLRIVFAASLTLLYFIILIIEIRAVAYIAKLKWIPLFLIYFPLSITTLFLAEFFRTY